ncbi:MAG: WbqC family protein, partial [Campylobacteraceae bacterium]|nr:WbqC family protein [Campylobacteraceae bacterium]
MTTSIMQAYFLPYLGYWQLINSSDTFVIYDNIQFNKNGWFHRNN